MSHRGSHRYGIGASLTSVYVVRSGHWGIEKGGLWAIIPRSVELAIVTWRVGEMPRNKGEAIRRKNIRIPEPLVDEVDEIVRENRLYVNRQQFVESAIREKIEKVKGVGVNRYSKD